MEALPDPILYSYLPTLYGTKLFKKIIYEPIANAALCAIAFHPKKLNILVYLRSFPVNMNDAGGIPIERELDPEDFKRFVIDMANALPAAAKKFAESLKSGNNVPIEIS